MFKQNVLQESWENVYTAGDVHESYDNFISIITVRYNDCCPVRKVSIGSKKVDKPWITNGLRNACKKENQLYLNFIKNRTFETEQKYKRYKNKLTSILRCREEQYYTDLLKSHKYNTRETWKVLNGIIKKKRNNNSNFPETFVYNDRKLSGKDAADGFNHFFNTVGPELASKIPSQTSTIHDYLREKNVHSKFLRNTDENEILNIVRNFGNKLSLDCNDFSMALVKDIIPYVIQPFTFICNKTFSDGICPDSMKVAKIVPLYKSGDKDMFTNYRPVSLLPQFSKILEKLFDERLESFIVKYNILSESQFGFRSGRSTSMALLDLIEKITTALDNKQATIGVFIDLKKPSTQLITTCYFVN